MSESVRLDVLVAAMARRGTPVAPESALFMVLEAVDAVRTDPHVLRTETLSLGADGLLRLSPDARRASEPEVIASVAELLDAVLLTMPASVIELVSRIKSAEFASIAALSSELEAMLVPLNRSAARRMLGRLVREHDRATNPTAPSALASHPDGSALERDSVGALLASAEPSPEASGAAGALDTLVDPPRAEGGSSAADTVVDGQTLGGAIDSQDELEPKRRGEASPAMAWGLMLLSFAAVAAGVWFVWMRLRGR